MKSLTIEEVYNLWGKVQVERDALRKEVEKLKKENEELKKFLSEQNKTKQE